VQDPSIDLDANSCANIVVVAGVGFGISKVLTGLLVDAFDARVMVFGFLTTTAALVLLFSFAESYETMLVLAFLNALPQAGGFPALNKVVYESLPPSQYPSAIAAISIGSRLGAGGSYLIMGTCLSYMSWRNTICVAPAFVLLIMIASSKTFFSAPKRLTASNSTLTSQKPKSERTVLQKLSWIGCSSKFWLVSLASACLLVSKGFEAIAPLFISQVLRQSAASSTVLVSAIPIGLVVSVLFGASVIDPLPLRQKAMALIGMCSLNVLTSLIMCAVTWQLETGKGLIEISTHTATAACTLLFFTLGFSAGYPFYVPQSLFAIAFGGSDSATVVGCSELVQAMIGASSLKMAGMVSTGYGWRYVWVNIVGFALIALASMSGFQYILLQEERVKHLKQLAGKNKKID